MDKVILLKINRNELEDAIRKYVQSPDLDFDQVKFRFKHLADGTIEVCGADVEMIEN
ncbi:hypothetical protein OYT88_06165 [Sporolactobacillus sp. CQH2019]|uniref:hypothetical protein n=1 Tax=Sporolactobacillus sp. CQH2019 TaxID=3023512 RepID=UPI00236896BD|nr:hypothetical protein [Sporolactobacillus sp. CQH2019]MDD9148131.1 hypothetical protein [Sporolactobacillus sp. CQH2019]